MLQNLGRKIYFKLFGKYSPSSLLSKELESEWRILDVGCGQASVLRSVRKGSYRIGLDFFKPYILKSKKSLIHDDYVLGDVRALPFKPESFDCAVAIEVLEHLPKHEGLKMIAEMERVAKKIILTTPNGFFQVYTGADALNPEERHISGWTASELKELGFKKVYGLGGLRVLWKAILGKIVPKFKPEKLFILLAGISEILVYRYPSLAFQLFAVKKS